MTSCPKVPVRVPPEQSQVYERSFQSVIIFNNNGSTFSQDHTTFVRLLLAVCNFPNIYNYSTKFEYPQVPPWQNGAALPLYGDRTTETITARMKSVAEDEHGLKMAELKFDIVQSDTDLTHYARLHREPHVQAARTQRAAGNCRCLPGPGHTSEVPKLAWELGFPRRVRLLGDASRVRGGHEDPPRHKAHHGSAQNLGRGRRANPMRADVRVCIWLYGSDVSQLVTFK